MPNRLLRARPAVTRVTLAWFFLPQVALVGAADCVSLKDGQASNELGAGSMDAAMDRSMDDPAPEPSEHEAGDAIAVADVVEASDVTVPPVGPCALGNTPAAGASASGTCDLANSPSCLGLASTCGPGESCCTSTHVPGDMYRRSVDLSQTALQDGHTVVGLQTSTSTPAAVSDFWLDRYEVTIGRFRRFLATYDAWRTNKPFDDDGDVHGVQGTGWSHALDQPSLPMTSGAIVEQLTASGCGSQSAWTDAGAGEGGIPTDNEPVTCVTWFVAYAFCIWDGGRLPTEAEWNYVAAGGARQRAFPWSEPATDTAVSLTRANLNDPSGLLPVGSSPMGAGFWGHQDLAGNAMEWTLDHCSDCNPPDYAQPGADLTQYLITPCDDCVETSGSSRILRGGSFKFWTALGRTATRVAEPPNNSYDDVGFRCARDPG